MRSILAAIVLAFACVAALFSQVSKVWTADNGDGTYRNPIIQADYSDPDVIRVGDDFYMTASSFNAIPGLPILHSKDLVSWRIINHALREQEPVEVFRKPQHALRIRSDRFEYKRARLSKGFCVPPAAYRSRARKPAK